MKITAILTFNNKDLLEKGILPQFDIDTFFSNVFKNDIQNETVSLGNGCISIKDSQWVDIQYETVDFEKTLFLKLSRQSLTLYSVTFLSSLKLA